MRIERDCILKQEGRIFVQITYKSKCKQSNIIKVWHGRKWYLSDYMTEDEIIKTLYIAFKSCVEHEVMENFTVNGITLFNPHINYKELLAISHKEVKRK